MPLTVQGRQSSKIQRGREALVREAALGTPQPSRGRSDFRSRDLPTVPRCMVSTVDSGMLQ